MESMTSELEMFLRKVERATKPQADTSELEDGNHGVTVPGIGPGTWNADKLAQAQETAAVDHARVFTLYTQEHADLARIVSLHFNGATITHGVGLWSGGFETAAVVTIVSTAGEYARVLKLAADINDTNGQKSTIVTWHDAHRIDVQ